MSVQYANIHNLTIGAIYASIIGSNIGAFLTPIGALAGIMFTNLLSKYEIKYSFIDFVKYGVIISIPTITISLLILSLIV
jgi:arsenical pump membrane protein